MALEARKELVVVFRSIYGSRNAFSLVASVIEDARPKTRMFFAEENPLPLLSRFREKGLTPIVFYSLSSPVFLELRSEIRDVASRGYIVVAGGPHAAGAYWQVLRLGVLAAVVGDGEPAVESLLDYFDGGVDLASVPNIAFRDGYRFRVTRIVRADLDEYKPYSKTLKLTPPVEIMRGCSYRCKFCQVPYLFKQDVRYRSLESIFEATSFYLSLGKKTIRFIAPIGLAYMSRDGRTPNLEALEALLKGVRSRGGVPFLGTFPSETRPEQVTRETLVLLKKYAGNRRLAIGMQTGSNRLLEEMWREHTVEEALHAALLAKKHGFTPVIDIIMGLPGETLEDIDTTINSMNKVIAIGGRIRLHTFIPLPGTPLALAKPGKIHPKYKKWIKKMLGRGVLEGDWVEQEELAAKIHKIMLEDPYPTPEPRPVRLVNKE